jgi:type II secretory pathway pseudopilin PulG
MEVMVALGLIAIVMAGAGTLFIQSMQSSKQQQQRQVASMLADQAIEMVRAHLPSTLLNGRTQVSMDTQWASPGPIDLSQSNEPTAVTTGTLVVPTTKQTYVVGTTSYSVNTIIGYCWAAKSGSSTCLKSSTTGPVKLYRVAVSATWSAGRGAKCTMGNGTCAVVTATLIDPSSDPTFNNN